MSRYFCYLLTIACVVTAFRDGFPWAIFDYAAAFFWFILAARGFK